MRGSISRLDLGYGVTVVSGCIWQTDASLADADQMVRKSHSGPCDANSFERYEAPQKADDDDNVGMLRRRTGVLEMLAGARRGVNASTEGGGEIFLPRR